MVEVKLQIEDSIIQTLGYAEVESYLRDSVKRLNLKRAAREILEDLDDFEIINDKQWQLSRQLVWEQESSKYIGT